MKLTLDLIPKTCWFSNVRSHVSKKQWDLIKSKVGSEAYYLCQICGQVGPKHPVEIHEIWHFNDKNLIQKLTGMIALCPLCHATKHFGLAQIQGKLDLVFNHFMKINNFSQKKAQKEIEKSFKIWEERSKKQWILDLSILKDYGVNIKHAEK